MIRHLPTFMGCVYHDEFHEEDARMLELRDFIEEGWPDESSATPELLNCLNLHSKVPPAALPSLRPY